jgi:hypothetical protein
VSSHEETDEFEDGRLGTVLRGVLNGGYKSADEVTADVKFAALKMGIKVVGDDEVDIGDDWETVFEVRYEKFGFRERG